MVPLGPAQALQPLCPAQMGPPKAAVIIFSLPCQQTSQGGHGIDEPPIDNLSQIRNHPTPSGQQLPKRSESISDGGGNDGTSPTILGLNKHCYPQAAVFHCHPYTQCKQHFFFGARTKLWTNQLPQLQLLGDSCSKKSTRPGRGSWPPTILQHRSSQKHKGKPNTVDTTMT